MELQCFLLFTPRRSAKWVKYTFCLQSSLGSNDDQWQLWKETLCAEGSKRALLRGIRLWGAYRRVAEDFLEDVVEQEGYLACVITGGQCSSIYSCCLDWLPQFNSGRNYQRDSGGCICNQSNLNRDYGMERWHKKLLKAEAKQLHGFVNNASDIKILQIGIQVSAFGGNFYVSRYCYSDNCSHSLTSTFWNPCQW
jgi:hypothetical protein